MITTTTLLLILVILVLFVVLARQSGAVDGTIVNVLWIVLLVLAIIWLAHALGLHL